jgi:hypothetical protein
MAKQQRLEVNALEMRKKLTQENDYQRGESHEYNADHKDAISDGDPLGKGTRTPLGVASRPGENPSKGISYSNIDTKHGGGLYDIEGRPEVGKSGRVQLMAMNLYNKENYYDTDSVDTTENRNRGQYFVE